MTTVIASASGGIHITDVHSCKCWLLCEHWLVWPILYKFMTTFLIVTENLKMKNDLKKVEDVSSSQCTIVFCIYMFNAWYASLICLVVHLA